ncbi:MAG: MmcB family DNA repair protein [Candidatus Omnitrophica bacterium]|nr:MmcB family DNA repair protein [Candidatus Omnitrophota bacterium]
MTANTILKLLLKRHKDDICVPECKAGPTWTALKTPRFDLWSMKRSYTNPTTWVYEIKVSRQDFLKDNKWQSYLPYCTDFYFTAPHGVIDVNEVPEQAGLLLLSKNGTRLYCKKKAPHREVEIPDSVFKYILMSRSKIVDSAYVNNTKSGNTKQYWQQWLDDKNKNQDLGYNVSRKIRQLYDKNVKLVKINQDRMQSHLEKLDGVKRILKELGFNENNLNWNYEERIRERISK